MRKSDRSDGRRKVLQNAENASTLQYLFGRFAIPAKLQIETLYIALQNAAYCEPIPWVLQAKMQHFAPQSHFRENAKQIETKNAAKVMNRNFYGVLLVLHSALKRNQIK